MLGVSGRAGFIKRVPEQARDNEKGGLGLVRSPRDPQRVGYTENLIGAVEEDT